MATPPSRVDLFVVARILERLWREGEPMLRTRLQVASNLNYENCTRYTEWLAARGLVTRSPDGNGHERVAITPKGYKAYAQLALWMQEFMREASKGPGGNA